MISNILNSFKEENNKLMKTKLDIDNISRFGLNAFLIATFILSAPMVIYINFIVMYGILHFNIFILLIILMGGFYSFLLRLFYYQQIKNNTTTTINYRFLLLIKSIIDFLIIALFFVIGMIFLF